VIPTNVPAADCAYKMPMVSIVIPTHNRSESLRHSIASVLTQTLQDFEIIVVDDASSDHTAEVAYMFADQRIKYIRHDANLGVAAARNTGIVNSRARYIAFLDDDDEWLPEKLARQLKRLHSSPTNVGAIYTSSLRVDRRSGRVVAQERETLKG
jgi:glycosyltransferase involved in cell wall biosynthesis